MKTVTHYIGHGTPEDIFQTPDPEVIGAFASDAILVCLDRADATVNLLQADGMDGEFTVNHQTIMRALWSIEADLEMARRLVKLADQEATHV